MVLVIFNIRQTVIKSIIGIAKIDLLQTANMM